MRPGKSANSSLVNADGADVRPGAAPIEDEGKVHVIIDAIDDVVGAVDILGVTEAELGDVNQQAPHTSMQ